MIFLGSDEILCFFLGVEIIPRDLEGVDDGVEAAGAFPFSDFETLGFGFEGVLGADFLGAED